MEPVARRELTRARGMLLATEAHDHETVTDLGEDLGSFAVDGEWRMALDTEARLGAITPRSTIVLHSSMQ